MMKAKPTTKEQLIYYLYNHISLGTYDHRFIENIIMQHITHLKPLTTNQSALLDKITNRYTKQLFKQEINVDELLTLPWNLPPIESSPQFTETHLILVDDELILRSPYKKDFVSDFKKLEIPVTWNREDKIWRVSANTYTLKLVVDCVTKHYNKVNYCDELSEFLAEVETFKNTMYWDPTYVYLNENFYILGTNNYLHEATKNLEFNIDLLLLSQLAQFHIDIDNSVINEFRKYYSDDEIKFASSRELYVETGDESIVDMLVKIKTDLVILNEPTSTNKKYFELIRNQLKENNIECSSTNLSLTNKQMPVTIISGLSSSVTTKSAKTIKIVNSKPISIK